MSPAAQIDPVAPEIPPYAKSWPATLRAGDSGPAVRWVQQRLLEQGFFGGKVLGNFGNLTLAALRNFKLTRLGPDGLYLAGHDLVDRATQWALAHPSGDAQRSRIDPLIPKGLTGTRRDFLKTVVADYRSGKYIEVPDGSNTGPVIKRFSRGTMWCCYYQSDAWHRTFGTYPLGRDHGHCKTFRDAALAAGKAYEKSKTPPLPGDLAILLYRNSRGALTGAGHIVAVGCVSEDGSRFNSFGGNEGNRLKHGERRRQDPLIWGWIDMHGDDRAAVAESFQRGLAPAKAADSSFASTR